MNVYCRYFLFLLIIILLGSGFAYGEETSSSSSWGKDSDIFNKGFGQQKAVSETKFKNTIKMLKERSLTNKQKKIKQDVQPLSPSSDFEHLQTFTKSQSPGDDLTQTLTVMIPMKAYSEEGVYISPGYYKLSCRQISQNVYVLELSQGNKTVLSVPAMHTKQDLEQKEISFCNAEIIDDGRIRLMYGSIDLNLVGYIYFK